MERERVGFHERKKQQEDKQQCIKLDLLWTLE